MMIKNIILLCFLPVSLFAESLKNLESAPDNSKYIKQIKINSFSDLQQLVPKDSVSVIQKRYMPKTFRGELNLSVSTVINHTFFYLGGVSAKAGGFIREDHGFGVEAFVLLPPLFKTVTNDMIGPPNGIVPLGAVLSQYYFGAYYKWSPVFGKFAVLNKKIVYFDMYMTLGAGLNRVVDAVKVTSEKLKKTGRELKGGVCPAPLSKRHFPALNLGMGQMFSITQNWAFNWDLKWFLTFVQYKNENLTPCQKQQYKGRRLYTPWDINFSIGLNYYFPGAKYR